METSEIRKSYLEILEPTLGVQGFDTLIPLDLVPLPNSYFIVSNVSRASTTLAKGSSSKITSYRNSESRVFLNVDVSVLNELGFHSSLSVETMVSRVIEMITNGINPNGYYIKETKVVNVVPLHQVTDTHNINRIVVSFEHWVSKRS